MTENKDKQYYVKLSFEFGVDNGDGTFESKNTGDILWNSMPMADAVILQNTALIPALSSAIEGAGRLGLDAIGELPTGRSDSR